MKKILCATLLFTAVIRAHAQAPSEHSSTTSGHPGIPVPVEAMVGNNRFTFGTVLIKRFSDNSRFGLLSVLTYMGDYDNNLANQDFIATGAISYSLARRFSLVGGFSINATTGLRGTAGVQYLYQTPTWLIVALPVIDLNKTYSIEPLGLVEYKPALSKKLRLYTKLQGYYNHETKDDFHARSYVHARIGLTQGIFTFGLAANDDWYGPGKLLKENYGVFARVVFK